MSDSTAVHQEIVKAWENYDFEWIMCAEEDKSPIPEELEEARNAVRTALLKHDPVVNGLRMAAQEVFEEWASEHLIPHGLPSEQETAEEAVNALYAALKAVRVALGENTGEGQG